MKYQNSIIFVFFLIHRDSLEMLNRSIFDPNYYQDPSDELSVIFSRPKSFVQSDSSSMTDYPHHSHLHDDNESLNMINKKTKKISKVKSNKKKKKAATTNCQLDAIFNRSESTQESVSSSMTDYPPYCHLHDNNQSLNVIYNKTKKISQAKSSKKKQESTTPSQLHLKNDVKFKHITAKFAINRKLKPLFNEELYVDRERKNRFRIAQLKIQCEFSQKNLDTLNALIHKNDLFDHDDMEYLESRRRKYADEIEKFQKEIKELEETLVFPMWPLTHVIKPSILESRNTPT